MRSPSWLWVTSGWNWMPKKRSFHCSDGRAVLVGGDHRGAAGRFFTVSEWLIQTCETAETPS
jgi:hypothetical protein